MAQRLVFRREYPVSGDALMERLERVLREIDGVTLIRVEEDRRRAVFQTGVTCTSWGQNMIATMEALGVARTRLTVGGQMRHTFLSSGWGERVHARGFARDLERALDRAMAIE